MEKAQAFITILHKLNKQATDKVTYTFYKNGEEKETTTCKVQDLSLHAIHSVLLKQEGEVFHITEIESDTYIGKCLTILKEPGEGVPHQNIFEAPEGVVVDDEDGMLTLWLPDGSKIDIPKAVINTESPFKGNLYFDDFSKVMDYAFAKGI